MSFIARSKTFVKAILVIFGVPVMLLGAVALGLGLWVVFDNPSFISLTHLDELSVVDQSFVKNGCYILIAAGATLLICGAVGLVATFTESVYLLGLYVALLSLLLSLEVAGLVLGILFKHTWETNLETAVKNGIQKNYDGMLNSDNYFTKHFNNFQKQMECCGLDGYTDFTNASQWNTTTESGGTMQIPPACCRSSNETDIAKCVTNPTITNAYLAGCRKDIEEVFVGYQTVVISVAATMIVCELILMVLALVMICSRSDNSYMVNNEK